MSDQEQGKVGIVVTDPSTEVAEVVDEGVPAGCTETAKHDIAAHRLPVSAVVTRVDDLASRAQRLGESIITLAVLGDAVRDLNDAERGGRSGLPTVRGDGKGVSGGRK